MSEKPYWYPVLADDKWRTQLREDYPDKADWTDDELDDYFNEEDSKYSITWDHLGDAYNDYEALADAYLELEAKLRAVGELPRYPAHLFLGREVDGDCLHENPATMLNIKRCMAIDADELEALLKTNDEPRTRPIQGGYLEKDTTTGEVHEPTTERDWTSDAWSK